MEALIYIRKVPETEIVTVTAHAPGEGGGLLGAAVSFEDESALIGGFEAAGIVQDRYRAALDAAKSGYGTNLAVSLDELRRLNIL